MKSSTFWSAGAGAFDQMFTVGWCLLTLKITGYVPAIQWSVVAFFYVFSTACSLIAHTAADYYKARDSEV